MYALLIATDEDDIAVFSTILQRAGLAVTLVRDLEQAMQHWMDRPADFILLALYEQPPEDQVRLVRTEAQVPLALYLAQISPQIHSDLLYTGADLVIPPTFNHKVLTAQIAALLRRGNSTPTFSLPNLSATNFSLDPSSRTIEVHDKSPQRLTHLEFRLLYTLMLNRGQIIPTEALVERVWGYTGQGDRELVRGLISRLRSKVEVDARNPNHILTVPGVGYQFVDDYGLK